MTITIVTPAESKEMTLLQTVKDLLGITDASQDAVISFGIKAVSDFVTSYCGREFALEEVTETLPGHGNNTLLLTRRPIVSISSVLYEGEPIVDYTIKNANAGILYREYGWANTAGHHWGLTGFPVPNSEKEAISVTYTAGYVLPSYAGTRDFPYDLEQAVVDLIKLQIDKRAQEGMKSVKVGNYQVQFGDSEIPVHIKSVLDKYKVVI